MIVNKYGRVAGSINLATLAQMYAETTDDDLKAHYREVAAESGIDLDDAAFEPKLVGESGPEVFVVEEMGSVIAPEPEIKPEAEIQPQRPADYAAKADWIAWAVYKGADESDASAATKAELIELYGGE